ncbi:hypothetical protein AWW66_29495 [Micromonospora rosaria]|uniref:Uncharacterized protein n=1 Tax=Micromonospora rosaria TaxID=47874 RepID=A0A136PJG3_9ACTN|nr:hypothetical protein [Micromonospora rosaria]KXK58493.1 hypothetical protein AWW66_29495 [Micromonospora rosaria]
MTVTANPPTRVPTVPIPSGVPTVPAAPTPPAADARRYRPVAYADGPAAALRLLHATTSPGVLPVGPGGHALVPADIEAACDRYATGAGPRPRAGVRHDLLDRVPVGADALIAVRVPGGGPPPHDTWTAGLLWLRLGLAERSLAHAVAHLRGRSVAGTVTLNLPMVRGMVADAAAGLAEAHALLETVTCAATCACAARCACVAAATCPGGCACGAACTCGAGCGCADGCGCASTATCRAGCACPGGCSCGATPRDGTAWTRAHHALDEAGRVCLHLFGAVGFLADGPGAEVRAAELLADTYPPPTDLEAS